MHRKLKPTFRFGFSNALKTDRFPEKLYEVAEDDYLIHWNASGTGVFIDENGFSDDVMECYPGFLQIPDFLNMRRLLREYSFDWEQNGTIFEFIHPSFIRGKTDLLYNVLTRRRSYHRTKDSHLSPCYKPDISEDCYFENPSEETGRLTRRGFIPFKQVQKEDRQEKEIFNEKKAYKIHERPSLIKSPGKENKLNGIIPSDINTDKEEEERLKRGTFEENQKAMENIINVFALNELSPEEFLEYLQRKRSKLIPNEDVSPSLVIPSQFTEKKTDVNIIDFPLHEQPDFQFNDLTFTQIRPTENTEEYSPGKWKLYHTMNNVIEVDSENMTTMDFISETNCCKCNCHFRT